MTPGFSPNQNRFQLLLLKYDINTSLGFGTCYRYYHIWQLVDIFSVSYLVIEPLIYSIYVK